MDDRKICFIMCVNNEELAERSQHNLKQLIKPDGFTVDLQIVRNASGLAVGYDQAMRQSDAKYKVYLHQDVHILNSQFLVDIVRLFSDYPLLGMIGTVGAKTLPYSGNWQDASQKYGKLIDSHTGPLQPLEFMQPAGEYETVESLSGPLIVTQYDLPWRKDLFTGSHFYDASHSQEFISSGYEVGVPKQHLPWCLHNCGILDQTTAYEDARHIFLEYYGYGKTHGQHRFHRLGSGCNIHPSCQLSGTTGIALGNEVKLQADCCVTLPYNNMISEPRIQIGSGSDIGRRCSLSAVNRIIIGAQVAISTNVHISDHNPAYENIHLPVMKQGVDSWSHTVTIGAGSWIGANTVIAGEVSIGKGCVIGAGSVVVSGTVIPDYCVASGTPAKVIRQYDLGSRKWLRTSISSGGEAEYPAEKAPPQPLMSICIPSYNSREELDLCLKSIYSQNTRAEDFEVIVSDDASTDHTEELVQKYQANYSNLRYYRNKRHEGSDSNTLKCAGYARGEFIKLHGSDDYWLPGSLEAMYSLIDKNRDCSLLFLDILSNNGVMNRGSGISKYIEQVSIYITFLSGIIMRRKEFEQIAAPELFIDSNLTQVYLELSILEITPDYCVYHRKLLTSSDKITGGYSFAQTFIHSYLGILNYFLDKGLDAAVLAAEKKHIAHTFLLWWYNYMLEKNLQQLQPGDFAQFFVAAYQDETYYPELHDRLHRIQAKHLNI
ncbi:glycosyltransferase [Paenibacillus sp. FSL R7-0204]|uniref:glycosyltransferase n=1 Tax=Paenibacillus sp. FSL R7-0204 TaxID=2921675 RepID=UPI0030F6BA74